MLFTIRIDKISFQGELAIIAEGIKDDNYSSYTSRLNHKKLFREAERLLTTHGAWNLYEKFDIVIAFSSKTVALALYFFL